MKKVNKNIVRKLLSTYAGGANCDYPRFSKPYRCNDFVIATDTKIFLRVNYNLVGGKYENLDQDIIPMQKARINSPKLILTTTAIEDTFDKFGSDPSYAKISCPFCEQDNRVPYDFVIEKGMHIKMRYVCPMCDGLGKIKNGYGYYIKLVNHAVEAQYIALLYKAMTTFDINASELYFTSDEIALFHLSDGIDIAISLMRGDFDGYEIIVESKKICAK